MALELLEWSDRFRPGEREWVILGKGPSFARVREFDLRSRYTCALNHLVREMSVTLAHAIDIDVVRDCAEAIDRNARFLILPFRPHVSFRPSDKTIHDFIKEMPVLQKLDREGRLVFYHLASDKTYVGEGPVIGVKFFSAEAALNLLVACGVKRVRSLGVDGGTQYAPQFSDLSDTTRLANEHKSFDLQFREICRTIRTTGVFYAPLWMDAPIRVFVGTDPTQMMGVRILEYSIKKHTPVSVEVRPLDGSDIPIPRDPANRARTGFSFCRFQIPRLCGYQGRGMYMDADMMVLSDLSKVWTPPMGEATVVYADHSKLANLNAQYSVLLLDCARLRWDVDEIVRGLDEGKYDYRRLMQDFCVVPEKERKPLLPAEWNSLDHYEAGRTCLIHFTKMPTQPWVSPRNPHGDIWYAMVKEALSEGFITTHELYEEVARGHVSPMLPGWVGLPVRGASRDWKAPYLRLLPGAADKPAGAPKPTTSGATPAPSGAPRPPPAAPAKLSPSPPKARAAAPVASSVPAPKARPAPGATSAKAAKPPAPAPAASASTRPVNEPAPGIAWLPKSRDAKVASVRYRCLIPLERLRARRVPIALFREEHEDRYQAVIFSKQYDANNLKIARKLRARGALVVLDLCDNHFFNPYGLDAYTRAAEDLRAMISLSDLVVCSTPALRDVVLAEAPQARRVEVVGDPVERSQVPLAPHASPARLLWFGIHGTPNAPCGMLDLLKIAGLLERTSREFALQLVVCSNNRAKYEEHIRPLPFATEYVEFEPETFPALLASASAALIPIADNPFTFCKSHNRLTTALEAGVPVIADSIPSYREFAPFCYLDDWAGGLRVVLSDPASARARAKLARKYIDDNWTPEHVAAQWERALLTVAPSLSSLTLAPAPVAAPTRDAAGRAPTPLDPASVPLPAASATGAASGVVKRIFGAFRGARGPSSDRAASQPAPEPRVASERRPLSRQCPHCGVDSRATWLRGRKVRVRVDDSELSYVRCERCNLIYLSDPPGKPAARQFHAGQDGAFRADELSQGAASPVERLLQSLETVGLGNVRARRKIRASQAHPDPSPGILEDFYRLPRPGATFLDLGGGSKSFLDGMRRAGWKTIGADFDDPALAEVRAAGHAGVLVSDVGLSALAEVSADLVRMNDVIGRFAAPRDALTQVRARMKPGAALHLAAPNPEGMSAALFRAHWSGLDGPRQVVLYPPDLLEELLKDTGFSIIYRLHRPVTEDLARSLGLLLSEWHIMSRQAASHMATEPLLSDWLTPLARSAASRGRGDRVEFFCRRP